MSFSKIELYNIFGLFFWEGKKNSVKMEKMQQVRKIRFRMGEMWCKIEKWGRELKKVIVEKSIPKILYNSQNKVSKMVIIQA